MSVSVADVLILADRFERSGRPNVADALFSVAGRMDRSPGWDGYDVQYDPPDDPEPDAVAAIRGRARLARLCPAIAGGPTS